MLNRRPPLRFAPTRRGFCLSAGSFLATAGLHGGAAADPPAPLWQPGIPGHRAFLGRAIELARRGAAQGDGTPYGAVIVRGDLVVAEAWNRSRRNTDPTAHAEVEAIREAARRLGTRDLSGCVMYTNGGRPCAMCETAAHWARLDRLYHDTDPAAPVDAGRPRYGGC